MYAIIENGGKQYKVVEGDTLQLEKLDVEVGSIVKDSKVLMIAKDDSIEVGTPVVLNAEVVLKVLAHGKGEKILIFKYKAKKNYRRKQGHRQPFTEVIVEQISLNGVSAVKEVKAQGTAASATVEKTVAKKPVAAKTATAKKTVAKKPATAKTATAKKPAVKKPTAAKKPAAKKTEK